jgi:hypothetical protein
MLGLTLQDWISIQGDNTTATLVTQGETDWLDASQLQDLVFWTHCGSFKSGGGTLNISLQTSPFKSESSFANMATVSLAAGVQATPVLLATATVPVARWVRWQFSATAPTGLYLATFRILASANARGM